MRKHTAEQLYLQLLGEDDDEGVLDSVMETLSEVAWDGDVAAARVARSALFEPLALEPPKAAAAKPGGRPALQMLPLPGWRLFRRRSTTPSLLCCA